MAKTVMVYGPNTAVGQHVAQVTPPVRTIQPKGSVATVLRTPIEVQQRPASSRGTEGSRQVLQLGTLADSSVPAAVGTQLDSGTRADVPRLAPPFDTRHLDKWDVRESAGQIALCSWVTENPNVEETKMVLINGTLDVLGRELGQMDEHELASRLRKGRAEDSVAHCVPAEDYDAE